MFVSLRSLSKDRRLSLLAIFALALRIGAATVVLSVIHNGLLHPFPQKGGDEIIGVVSDAKNRGLQEPVMPEAFFPYTLSGFGDLGILVRTAVDPDSLLNSVRKEIWGCHWTKVVSL